MKTHNLSDICIWKELVDGQYFYHAKTEVYLVEFTFGTKQYNARIYPWLDREYGDYCEGGYVTGVTCTYTWTVDDITEITFYDNETGEYGDTVVSEPIKTMWLQELSDYMTDKELFTCED